MTVRRICYVLLLAAGFYFVMLYDFQGLRFLLCCAVCLPITCLLLLVPGAFLCQVGLEIGQEFVTRGEPVKISMIVENKSFLPVSRILVAVRWRAPGEKEVKVKKWLCGFGRGHQEVVMELSALHCGQAQFAVTKARICDYLGLFSLPVKKAKPVEICIVPVISPISREEIEEYSLHSLFFSKEKDGDVVLRDYQPGDNLHRVYWKLSAKAGELQVRELEQDGSMIIFLNFSDGFKKQTKNWDKYLDKVCSLLCFLTDENQTVKMIPKVVWQQNGSYWKYEISGIEALQAWVYAMLMEEGMAMALEEEEIPFLENGCHLEEDCKLYLGEQCVYE